MASLSSIMNVDDGQDSTSQRQRKTDTSVPNPSQTAGSQAPPAASTYPSPYTSTSAHGHLRSSMPPSLPIYPSEPLPSPTALAAQGESSRRPSTTSTDSMDSPYGQVNSYPYTASPVSHSMSRPMPNSSSTSSSVKLTPVTKKPSRALKGVPVHVCELCQPPKTFTRAEHLRRHQLSHTPPELHCMYPGCGRVFHRRDLLDRHQQRHEQDRPMPPGDGRRSEIFDPLQINQPYHMAPGMAHPIHGGHAMSDAMTQRSWPPHSGDASHGAPSAGPSQIPGGPGYPGGEGGFMPGPYNYTTSAATFPTESLAGEGLGILGQPIACDILAHDPPSFTTADASVTGPYTDASDSSRRHLSAGVNPFEWAGPLQSLAAVPRDFASPMAGESRSMWSSGYGGSGYGGSPPPIFPLLDDGADFVGLPYGEGDVARVQAMTTRALSPGTSAAFPTAAVVAGPAPLPLSLRSGCGTRSNGAPGISNSGTEGPLFLDRETVDAIPDLLKVYWDRVHPLYPIVHMVTLGSSNDDDPELVDVVRFAMAAIATQLSSNAEDRIRGHQLHAYAWHKSKKFTNCEDWSIPAMQTVLLCEYYSRFRGRSGDAYKASPRFQVLLDKIIRARARGLLQGLHNFKDEGTSWRTWVASESLRRLLSAAFLLDVHGKNYLEQTPQFSSVLGYHDPQNLCVPLTMGTTELWDAPTLGAWKEFASQVLITKNVSDIPLDSLTARDIASATCFDQVVLLAVHSLRLPQRDQPTKVPLSDSGPPIDPGARRISMLFPETPCGNTYLALHHTPLQTLLCVCGDSWLLNMKVQSPEVFLQHHQQLEEWRNSGTSAVATIFAARALRSFLGIRTEADGGSPVVYPWRSSGHQWKDMSDFWAVYVCALICWTFGTNGGSPVHSMEEDASGEASITVARQWITDVATMEPAQVYDIAGTSVAQGVVRLVLPLLEMDCTGGRNMLYGDAVNVLKKLVDGDRWRWA